VPAARAALTLAALGLIAGCAAGPDAYVLLSEPSPDRRQVALVRLAPCGTDWCQSLWVGPSPERATQLAVLAKGVERADEIAWRKDGSRVALLVDGYQLRLYDPQANRAAGLVDLVVNDGRPTSRVARGVTFSDNGVAVTFDDCPRDRSGCRPGMTGIR
jgi:hypothetical protein